jgi:hypothetical protein
MQTKSANFIVRAFYISCTLLIMSADVLADSRDPLLFESDSILELVMPVNFSTLCRPSLDPECDYTPTVFKYRDVSGNDHTIPISIRRRDGWRARQTNCQVPTLFVQFSEEDAVDTPFEGQQFLALTSHCGKGVIPENVPSRRLQDEFESYVITEYLGYRLNNLFTDVSLRARLVRITYTNVDNPRDDFTHYAFFTEHFESLAKRLHAELLPTESFDPEKLDVHAADQMALFQYMIGNTDWSIIDQENIILLQFPEGKQVPVLYDLDLSGLVNAYYATPSAPLPIKSVKQRYYLGFCHPESDWISLFRQFNSRKRDVMAVLADTPGLGRGDQRVAGVYLESFFRILGSPKSRENAIVNACQPWPT